MLNELMEEMNYTFTEKGALAYRSSGSACLDLFSAAGAMRFSDHERAKAMFIRAYAENRDYAMRILFYARDIRGGLGERTLFRELLMLAADKYPESIRKNIENIPFYGRYDDCLCLLETPCEEALVKMLKKQLDADISAMTVGECVSLLCKWLPSVNASSEKTKADAKRLCALMKMPQKDYRRTLSSLRGYIDILETKLTEKDYTFNYEKQPSKALYKYRRAFLRHDRRRYMSFIDSVNEGKAQLKTGSLLPYDIIRSCRSECDETKRKILDTTWRNLPDLTDGRNAIAVVDGSGSMYYEYAAKDILPIDIAVSLGIYFAERNSGYFHNHFITFSTSPRMVEIKGNDIYEKAAYCMSYNEVSNTDLTAVFIRILNAAIENRVPQSELPETVYVISDMEFDAGCLSGRKTIFKGMKELYSEHGYRLPTVVYWNVCSRNEQVPVTENEAGAVLVSGCSPTAFAAVTDPGITPSGFMKSVLESERYRRIAA